VVGLQAVVPVAAQVEQSVQGTSELPRQLGRQSGRGRGGLGDGGQQVGPLGLQPGTGIRRVPESQAAIGPAWIGGGRKLIAWVQQRQGVPGGGGVEAEQAQQRGQPLTLGVPAGGVLAYKRSRSWNW
jgi:hypothetical protein